jgi:predicted transcriptional regulator
MRDSPFVIICKEMVEKNTRVFPSTENNIVSAGSWQIIKLVAAGKTADEIEKTVGKSWANITRHIKGQRTSQAMENALLLATNTENPLSAERLAEYANESLAQDKKDLAEMLTNISGLLINFLNKSNAVDREELRNTLNSKTKQDLRLGVQALMSEVNFNQIKKEGGLK